MNIKKIILMIFLVLLFIFIFELSIFIIIKYNIKVDYTALATIISIIALLYTIIKDRKETKKLIDYNIKFIKNSEYEYIDDNLSDKINNIACNYTFELLGMKNKIIYFYKYKDISMINKLLMDIDNINQLLSIDLASLATLRVNVSDINFMFSNVKYENDFKSKKKVINNTHKKVVKFNKTLFEITKNINKTINDNYNLVLNDAIECINKRKDI